MYYIYRILTQQFTTGIVAQSVAQLSLNRLVREVPGSIPTAAANGEPIQKLSDFFYISKGSGYACLKVRLVLSSYGLDLGTN